MAALPTHETLPADHKAAIRQMKQALRAQIGDVRAVFDKLSARISERLQEIETLKAAGGRSGQPFRSAISPKEQ